MSVFNVYRRDAHRFWSLLLNNSIPLWPMLCRDFTYVHKLVTTLNWPVQLYLKTIFKARIRVRVSHHSNLHLQRLVQSQGNFPIPVKEWLKSYASRLTYKWVDSVQLWVMYLCEWCGQQLVSTYRSITTPVSGHQLLTSIMLLLQ